MSTPGHRARPAPDAEIMHQWADAREEARTRTTAIMASVTTDIEWVRELAQHPSLYVRRAAASNPQCPVEVLIRLLVDPDPQVRESTMGNRNLPEEYRLLRPVRD